MKKSTKIYLCITGILLIGLGIFCLCHPGATILSMALIIGCSVLVSGISTLLLWANTRRVFASSGTFLLSGILQIFLGLLFINNNFIVATVLPLIFSMWIFIEGIVIAIRSFDYKNAGVKTWWVGLIFGVLVTLLGVQALKSPVVVGGTLVSTIVSIALIVIGVIELCALVGIKRFESRRWSWIDEQ